MHYYQFHISDFRAGTVHLSRLERWIYRDLLDVYYDTENPLPLSVEQVCRLVSARTEEEIDAVRYVLAEKFCKLDDGFHHARCDDAIAKYQARQVIAQAKGARGGAAKASRQLATASRQLATASPQLAAASPQLENPSSQLAAAKPQLSSGLANEERITNNEEPSKRKEAPEPIPAPPEWVSADDWQAYAESRKRLRKPMTAAAARLVFRELTKIRDSGLDPDEALRNSVMHGWTGVFPPKQANNGATHGNAGKQRFSVVADAYAVIDRERARAFAGGVGGETSGSPDGDLRTEVLVHLPGRSGGA